ncbi:hypothetical protein ACHQM5_008765 [Ranunculus cassubicifolius]
MALRENNNHQISKSEEEDFLFAMQLTTVSVLPMVMQTAIELDLFEIIAKAGPGAQVSPTYIASQLSTENPNAPNMLDRLLRLLASNSVLVSSLVSHEDNKSIERVYGLASVCKYFRRNDDGVSLSPVALLVEDNVYIKSWPYLKDSILRGGIPFNKAHGMHIFDYLRMDSRFYQVFNTAMSNHTTLFANKMLQTYKGFEGINEIVDVGGGYGHILNRIITNYPTINGINFDLPHVIEHAPSYPGVKHLGGDMFDQVPHGETIFMKWILHDWSDEDCLKLLKNCYNALPVHGKLIIVEEIQPDAVETSNAAKGLCQMDVIMMTQILDGKERTEEEFRILLTKAGFACMTKACSIYNYWVLESYKV